MRKTVLTILVILFMAFGKQIFFPPIVQSLLASSTLIRPLLATEEQVNQFFEQYMERYMSRDVEEFLKLFSSKATQNQVKGLPAIREIYSSFFDQSEKLQYRMKDRAMEIYENAVEVKAYYEIEQVTKKSGEIKNWKGRGRWVLIREGEGLKILTFDYQNEKSH